MDEHIEGGPVPHDRGVQRIPSWMEGVAFTVAEGREAGLTDAQMRNSVYDRPFHGVRLTGVAGRIDGGGVIDQCSDLSVALPRGALFSHATAARLWGMPLPAELSQELHALVPGPTAVRRPGVIGWVRPEGYPRGDLVHALPVTTPTDTWAMLATMTDGRGGMLSREWLVAIGDFLISGKRTKRGREPALATLAELAEALERHGSRRGAASLAWALGRVRSPVDSPPETFTRLGLVAAHLPEPAVQPPIMTTAGVRHPDLGYLAEKVLIEYLGDVHRTDKEMWRKDLTRVQLFEDAGYRVILAGADDITPEGLRPFAARVRRALRRARPSGAGR